MCREAGAGGADPAARLAGIADALGETMWADELRRTGVTAIPAAVPPTWGDLAITGLEVVEDLAIRGDWAAARDQAAFLADFFTRMRKQLHGVAGVAFEGLASAARAHDPDDLAEHSQLIRELFGSDDAPAGAATA